MNLATLKLTLVDVAITIKILEIVMAYLRIDRTLLSYNDLKAK